MDFKSLEPLLDAEYEKARNALIDSNRNALQNHTSPNPAPIPDLGSALRIRALEPAKSAQYSDAVALKNKEYLDPRQQAKNPTADQLKDFLGKFDAGFLPLLEEYFFQFPSRLTTAGTRAVAMILKEKDPARCKQIAALSYAKFHGHPEAQRSILSAIEMCRADAATQDLWKTYRTAADPHLRLAAQYVLAVLGDLKMKAEIESSLSKDELGAEPRSKAISAYLQYLPGTPDEKLVSAFRKFRNPATQLRIAQQLFVSQKGMAATLKELKKEASSDTVKAELQDKIQQFESMESR